MASPSSSSIAGATPFELLGLPARYDLDTQVIERAFFDRSKEWHADKFASAPASERVAALSRSRALNDAYAIVKKPVPRAECLLAQAGVTIGDHEQLDPTFLMEILELREELAEATAAKQAARVAELERAMRRRRDAAIAQLGPQFVAGDLAAIKRTLIVLRYLERYLEACTTDEDDDSL